MVDAMYKMILKQLWNERKGNLFIWLEMLVVSIFLWYAADALFVMYKLYSDERFLTPMEIFTIIEQECFNCAVFPKVSAQEMHCAGTCCSAYI